MLKSNNGPGDYHRDSFNLTEQIEKAKSRLTKITSPDPLLSKAMTDVLNTADQARGEAFADLSSKHQGRVDKETFEAGSTFFQIGGDHVSKPMTARCL
jgi:predicted metallo-beta-lactamase superfamily hydrolase